MLRFAQHDRIPLSLILRSAATKDLDLPSKCVPLRVVSRAYSSPISLKFTLSTHPEWRGPIFAFPPHNQR